MAVKQKHSVGYFSSYDRGLECLLALWPQVREQVPDATLDIYYGWNLWDKIHSKNPQMMKKKWQIIKGMSQDGVTEHGRVSHTELAQAMKQTKVWAYPTEFTEIHCITALKAQEAGCIPVTTLVAALQTSVADHSYSVACDDIYTNETKQKEFVDQIVRALKTKEYQPKQVDGAYWPEVAQVWNGVLDAAY